MKTAYYKLLRDLSETLTMRISAEKEGTKEYTRWFECQRVLTSVIKYALNNDRGTLQEKVKVFWETGCSYEDTMERIDVSYETIRACIARASRKLYDELGTIVLEFIEQGKPVDAHVEFMVRTGQLVLDDVIPLDIANILPKPAYNPTIQLEECTEELKMLKALTFISLRQQLQSVNPNKVAHLLAIMGGEGDYASIVVKKQLWGYLIGKNELKQMMNELKVKNLIP